MKRTITILGIIAFALLLAGCENPARDNGNETPGNNNQQQQDAVRQQTAIINLFNNQRTATVQGYMTNAQWEGVVSTIAVRLNLHYEGLPNPVSKEELRDIFYKNIVYIVEPSPTGFTRTKTIDDHRTVHIALAYVNSVSVTDVFTALFQGWPTIDGIIQNINARQQTATINLFNNQRTATVQGYMSNSLWEGVANTIAARLDAWYNDGNETRRTNMRTTFAREGGVVYIVEVNPVGFNYIKTTGDGRTAHIALSQIDSDWVRAAWSDMLNFRATIDGAIQTAQLKCIQEGQARRNNMLAKAGHRGRIYGSVTHG